MQIFFDDQKNRLFFNDALASKRMMAFVEKIFDGLAC